MSNLMPSPDMSLVNGRPAITSMQVAEYFGKQHAHVVRDIRRIISECEGVSNFGETPLFEETTYADEQNGQAYPMFIIYRDGFMLLAMGYTGSKAMKIKLVFIAAFNAMEAELVRRNQHPALESTATLSTADERIPLRALVHAWAQTSGIAHQALWPQVKAHFQLARIDDLPVEWIPDALAFVQGKIDALQTPKALPAPAPKPDPAKIERQRMLEEHIVAFRSLCNDFSSASDRMFTLFIDDDQINSLHIVATLSNYALLKRCAELAGRS